MLKISLENTSCYKCDYWCVKGNENYTKILQKPLSQKAQNHILRDRLGLVF